MCIFKAVRAMMLNTRNTNTVITCSAGPHMCYTSACSKLCDLDLHIRPQLWGWGQKHRTLPRSICNFTRGCSDCCDLSRIAWKSTELIHRKQSGRDGSMLQKCSQCQVKAFLWIYCGWAETTCSAKLDRDGWIFPILCTKLHLLTP